VSNPAVPSPSNGYHVDHARMLRRCYRELTGRILLPAVEDSVATARMLYETDLVVMSHNTATDPVFNYANLAAQRLFEMPWDDYVRTPSRLSAEPVDRAERARLMAAVAERGFIEDYHGVRISRGGRRFRIEQATVWNLFDEAGNPAGQAAAFSHWVPLG